MLAGKITIVIADDHEVTRTGLRAILRDSPDIAIVGEAESGTEARRAVANLQPQVLLLDLVMPDTSPSDIVLWAQQHHPETAVLILTAHDRDYYLAHRCSKPARRDI